MREILFRGKSKISGEWVFGAPICVEENTYPTDRVLLVRAVNYDELDNFAPQYESEEVIPATVGQFTGLYDEHGNKVFEGDIVEFNEARRLSVVFAQKGGTAAFGVELKAGLEYPFGLTMPVAYMAVVGNIHDNPELVKEERK